MRVIEFDPIRVQHKAVTGWVGLIKLIAHDWMAKLLAVHSELMGAPCQRREFQQTLVGDIIHHLE